jgi:hypothetical protein
LRLHGLAYQFAQRSSKYFVFDNVQKPQAIVAKSPGPTLITDSSRQAGRSSC